MRSWVAPSIAIALLAIGIWFYLASGIPAPRESLTPAAPSASASTNPPVSSTSQLPAEAATRWDDPSWDEIGNILEGRVKGRALLSDAQIESFLQKHGKTPVNILAAWESTGQRSWLELALQLFPNEPVVLLAALGDGDSKVPYPELAERFKKASPDNPLAWIFSAKSLIHEGRQDESMSEIREALIKPGFYTYSNERISAAQQLYLHVGIDRVGGEFLAIAQMPLDHLSAAMRTSKGLQELARNPQTTTELRAEIANLNYGIGRMFSSPEASRMLIGHLIGTSIESSALKLAQGLETNPLPVDPATRLAEIEKQKTETPELTEWTQKLMQMKDASLLSAYMQQLRTVGEREAIQWLKTKLR